LLWSSRILIVSPYNVFSATSLHDLAVEFVKRVEVLYIDRVFACSCNCMHAVILAVYHTKQVSLLSMRTSPSGEYLIISDLF
jgi:hypothetical protein